MDFPDYLFEGNTRQRAIQAQLLELFKADPVLEARQFLIDHPALLSVDTINILDTLQRDAAELQDSRILYVIKRYKVMLDTIWLICVEAPLEIPASYKPHPELAALFQETSISSFNHLVQRMKEKPQLRERFTQTALRFLSEVDWAVVLVLSKVRLGDELDTIWIAEECPTLVGEKAILSLNILLDWAQKRKITNLKDAIEITQSTINLVRINVEAGELELYEPRIRRLVIRYLQTQSWNEARQIITNHQDELLSDEGIGVMKTMLSKAIGNLFADSDIYTLGYYTKHLAILEQCKEFGINPAFSENPIPILPLELWAIAGLLRIGKPSVHSWSGFQVNLAENQMTVEFQAKLVYAALFEPNLNIDKDLATMVETPIRQIELETFKRITILQFALRETPEGLLDFIANNPVISEKDTLDLLDRLMARAEEREAEESAEAIFGLSSFLRSPYYNDFVSAFISTKKQLNVLLPNGAHLAILAGGLALILQYNTNKERLEFIRDYPRLTSEQTIQLINLISNVDCVSNLCQQLNEILPLIQNAANIGPMAAFVKEITSNLWSPTNQALLGQAILVWSSVTSYKEMDAAINEYPILLSDEALSMIENMVYTSKPEDDLSFFEEISGESISHEQRLEAIQQMTRRYAILLDARREKREKEAGFQLKTPDLPDAEYAAQLIRRLEITIQAKLWAPVSRIDLTPTFFIILDSWQQQVKERFGHRDAKLLENVTTQAKHWLGQFGELLPRHTRDLEQALQTLLEDTDVQDQLQTIKKYPQLLQENADSILRDWLVVSQVSLDKDVSTKISETIELLEKCRRTSPEIVARSKKQGKFQNDDAEFYKDLLDGQTVEEFADITQALLNMSEDQQIDLIEKMTQMIETSGAPDATGLSHRIRLLGLKLRLDKAIEAGPDAFKNLYETEPLLYEPEIIELMKEWGYSLATIESHKKLVQLFSDPQLNALRQQQLSSVQQADLEGLFDLVKKYILADHWHERFQLVKTYPQLLSDKALFLLEVVLEREVLNWLNPKEQEAIQQVFQDGKNFLVRCREVTPEIAAVEQMRRHLTIPDAFGPGEVNDLVGLTASLPLDIVEKLSSAQEVSLEEYLQVLEQSANSVGLEPSVKASLFAILGLHYKAQFEKDGQLPDLSKAIENYQKLLKSTDNNTPQYARHLKWLAICLISRFTDFGHNPQDIDKAIGFLQEALSTSLLDAYDLAQIYGHLGLAFKTRADAFSRMSDVEKAIKAYETAVSYARPGSEPWIGWHMNIANAWSVFWEQYHNPQALEHASQAIQKAIPYARKDSEIWQRLQYSYAQIFMDQGQAEGDVSKFNAAIEILGVLRAENPSKSEQAMIQSAIGHALRGIFKLTGQKEYLDQAVNAYKMAVDLTPQDLPDWVRYSNSLAITLSNRYEYYRDANDLEMAKTIFQEAVSKPFSDSWPHLLIDTAENFGNLCWGQGDYILARYAYAKVTEVLDLMRRVTTMTEDKADYSEEYVRVYARLVYCYLMIGDHAKAWEYASAAKARAFLDTLAAAPFELDISSPKLQTSLIEVDTIQRRLQHLRGLVTGEISPLNQIAGRPQSLDFKHIRNEIDQLQLREATIWKAIRQEYPQYAATQVALPLDAQKAKDIANNLNVTLLEFYPDAQGWGAFIITPQKIGHIRLSDQDPPWGGWIQMMFNLDDNTPRDLKSFNRVLREIYDFFFLPLEAHLPQIGSKLVLIQTDLMSSFPLTVALRSNGRYLLDDYVVGVSPGLGVLDLIRNKSRNRGYKRLLSVEYAGRKGEKRYLTNVDLETTTIASHFEVALRLKDEKATTAFIIEQVPSYNVIHFACHGFFNWRTPEASGLMLPGGSWLTIPDIFNRMRLPNASLVFLSACDVGQEYIRHGDEHTSLIRSFIYAGAPAVIAGLWSVADLSTMLLVTRFYSELKSLDSVNGNKLPAEALRTAQCWLRDASRDEIISCLAGFKRQFASSGDKVKAHEVNIGMAQVKKLGNPPFAHPYYWAAFQAVGDVF